MTAKNILLVEDDELDASLIAERLKIFMPASTVTKARSLKDAYFYYKEKNFDLVILDLNLPDGLGPHTVKEMRLINRKIPIIVVTSMGTKLTEEEVLRAGANDIIFKSKLSSDEFKNILIKYAA